MILLQVDRSVIVENTGDVVRRSGVIKRDARRNRHVLREPDVAVVNYWSDDPKEENEANSNVRFRPPWRSKWRTNVCDLRPIEGNERHSHSARIPKELVDFLFCS